MSATTTSPQELLQCEEDSFIPDDPDDKFYNDHIYNWEVMFETVKFFLMKEGRWPRCEREEDKRYVVMDREERQIQINFMLLLRNKYLEIIRNRSLLLAGCSGHAAWISLSPALIPVVEWEANLVQLLFTE